jgi:radical SAM protein with 4Fe4S-binding SPASM domain
MVKYASERGIYTATSTNGHYLNVDNARDTVASGLDRLIISIDGTTQETYEAYRIGGKLEKVLDGAANIVKLKKEMRSLTPHVLFQFLVVRPNEHQINDVFKLARSVGVDQVALKTAQIYDFQNGSELVPANERYARYKQQSNGTYSIKHVLLDHCWKMWHSCVVTWDGKIVPCCFDKDAHYILGDLSQNTFSEIWRGQKYQDFRRSLLHSRSDIEMCRNCTEGSKVWA